MEAEHFCDWRDDACPHCNLLHLHEQTFDSDEVDGGLAVACENCGFEIAGQTPDIIRSAMKILVRWRRKP